MKVCTIFDIGKTNKKVFLFDRNYNVVYKDQIIFKEIADEDGDPCDDLEAIQHWVTSKLDDILKDDRYQVGEINFSTYGASFVHIDDKGQPVAPLYNYLKPFPNALLNDFYNKYGPPLSFARETASPPLGMLNSGLQLYWLKYARPDLFMRIRWSLHFPQYLSHLFTADPASDFTNIGCHTGLWDFSKNDYHSWVYAEKIDRILPPIVDTSYSSSVNILGRKRKIGVGIHDSSSALIPYVRSEGKPFVLISTGTWCISLNPFSKQELSSQDLKNDCLNFMQTDGTKVKAARIFLGNEYKKQVDQLQKHFLKDDDHHKHVLFNKSLYNKSKISTRHFFQFDSIQLSRDNKETTSWESLPSFDEAYHQLMTELVELQIRSIDRAIGSSSINRIYIDGGFSNNEVYVQILVNHYSSFQVYTTKSPLGSSMGAAMIISDQKPSRDFLKTNYSLRLR